MLRYRSYLVELGVILKIDIFVAQIISAPNFDNFTTSEVRASYIAMKNDPSLDPISLRRKLYAELLKLVKKGWLIKKNSNNKGATRFKKTEFFDTHYLNSIQPTQLLNSNIEKETHKNLVAKLNHYKAELLLNMGESEAYKELYSEYPELIEEIQPLFNTAKDNNTRILGKIRAIEVLLKQNKTIE